MGCGEVEEAEAGMEERVAAIVDVTLVAEAEDQGMLVAA